MIDKKFTLISNMYPSDDHPAYGIFVKRMVDLIELNSEFKYDLIVIDTKTSNKFLKLLNYFKFFFKIFKEYKNGNNDILYIHFPIINAWLIWFLQIFKKKKIILNLHGGDLLFTNYFYEILNIFLVNLYAKSTTIIVPSLYFKNILLNKYPYLEKNKILIIPSGGFDPKIYYKPKSFKSNTLHIGFVSRLEKGKGWIEYLKIISKLNRKVDFKSSLVGYGYDFHKVVKMINELNLNNKVKLLGFLNNFELAEYFRNIDLLIIPTQLPESLCLVAIEALACGTPVISSNIGAIPEFIKDGYNGFLSDPSDLDIFCNKIISFSELNSEEKINMINNCAESVISYKNNISIMPLINNLNLIYEKH